MFQAASEKIHAVYCLPYYYVAGLDINDLNWWFFALFYRLYLKLLMHLTILLNTVENASFFISFLFLNKWLYWAHLSALFACFFVFPLPFPFPLYDVRCQAFVENNPAIRWCPRAGCERAVRLARQGPGASASDPLVFPLLQAPAVDCGKGHLFCWSVLISTTAP